MFNIFSQLPAQMQRAVIVGGTLGVILTVTLYTQVQWYHDLLVWGWTNPWMYVLGIPAGIAFAIATDND